MSVNESRQKNKVTKKITERYLRNAGEYYLNRFPASSLHFLIVMTRKIDRSCRAHPEQDREEWIKCVQDIIIPHFQKIGLINDELYAEAIFNSLKNKGFSKMKIKSRMTQKSIPMHYIEQHTNNNFNDSISVVVFAKKKKIGKFRSEPYMDDKEKQKDLGKLARAGFSYADANSVFCN